jgi:hypothetical protein
MEIDQSVPVHTVEEPELADMEGDLEEEEIAEEDEVSRNLIAILSASDDP